jgi:hypothetical protein
MKYIIKSAKKTKYIVNSKQELFECFDYYVRREKYGYQESIIRSIFCEDFYYFYGNSYEGYTLKTEKRKNIKRVNFSDYSAYYEDIEVNYCVNAWYIIYDEFGEKACLKKLIIEYYQSRKIKKNTHRRRLYVGGFSIDKKENKKSYRSGTIKRNKGLKSEFKDNEKSLSYNVKIRSKRSDKVRNNFYHDYDDYGYHFNRMKRSWKSYRKNQYKQK